jgi:PhnB protein
MAVKPIPDGYSSVTPYLFVDDAPAALKFYKEVFAAVERMRIDWGGGKVGHAEFEIGDSLIMLASEFPEMLALSPKSVGGTPVSLAVYVENVDEVFARAIAKGAEEVRPVANHFYGDRSGTFRDPSGHLWSVSTHVEDVTPEELDRRTQEMFAGSETRGE